MLDLSDRTKRLESSCGSPRLVASTAERLDYGCNYVQGTKPFEHRKTTQDAGPIIKAGQWSPDGTTIFTSAEDRRLRTYILPTDLLDCKEPHFLASYCEHELPSPVYATAVHPLYDLSSPSTALFLTSCSSMPTRLLSPFSSSIVASYPLIHAATETYLAPHSLIFSESNPNKFLAGTDSLIAEFDLSRPSSPPTSELPTIPSKRKTLVGGGVGMKGIVSAMALSSEGVLCAGTFTGWLGLYDSEGVGDVIAVFPIRSTAKSQNREEKGDGVTSVAWTNCGRYLVIAERGSDGMGVWDVRGSGKRLAWLAGRRAKTMQRLSMALSTSLQGFYDPNTGELRGVNDELGVTQREQVDKNDLRAGEVVWAGGTDGKVRAWANIGKAEGTVNPQWSFTAHDEAVSAVELHSYAPVLATCSGARKWGPVSTDGEPNSQESSDSDEDSSASAVKLTRRRTIHTASDRTLKLWSI